MRTGFLIILLSTLMLVNCPPGEESESLDQEIAKGTVTINANTVQQIISKISGE